MRLTAPVPEYAYFAEHVRQSAIADAVAQWTTAYLLRKRVDGLLCQKSRDALDLFHNPDLAMITGLRSAL